MKSAKFGWLGVLALLTELAAAQERALQVGEQVMVPTQRGAKFSVGNSEIIRVKPLPAEAGSAVLVVTGKRAGFSDLLVMEQGSAPRRETFRVRGKQEAAFPSAPDTKGALRGAAGVEVLPGSEGVVVRGGVQRTEDLALVDSLKELSRGRMKGNVELNAIERMKAEERIRRRLAAARLRGVTVRGAGSRIILEGRARTQDTKELAEGLAREIFPGLISHLKVPFNASEVLRFRVRLLEVEKSDRTQLGFQWTDTLPGVFQVQKNLLRAGFTLDAALVALAQRGKARVLSQPEIALNAEGVAELKVGGELPIAHRSQNYASTQWKPWGLAMKLEVPGVSDELVRTKILVDMTTLDPANAVDGVPALKTNQLLTTVDMKLGKPLFLSGLVQQQDAESAKGVPGLMDIPILGELFRSRDFLERRSELVVVLTAEEVND